MGLITERYMSPLGAITLASESGALVGLWFDGQKHFGAGYDIGSASSGKDTALTEAVLWLDSYFGGKRPNIQALRLNPQGSEFMLRVWNELMKIPYGETIAYRELAARIGCRSARAVGTAVGRNPLSVIIPCHRVVGANGSLTGYAGGIDRKRQLLELERSI